MNNCIKIYICKYCKLRGIRPVIRKHLREEHFIAGKSKNISGEILPSQLTKSTITREI